MTVSLAGILEKETEGVVRGGLAGIEIELGSEFGISGPPFSCDLTLPLGFGRLHFSAAEFPRYRVRRNERQNSDPWNHKNSDLGWWD